MKLQLLFVLLTLISETTFAGASFGDSASATARMSIVHKINIKKISDLNFGEASPGDGPKTVAPGIAENFENASFEIQGEPLRNYQIVLPPNNSVKMITGSGGVHREVTIREFASIPNRAGFLDSNGRSFLFVGATREAISPNQKTGDYSGQFYVTVVY